jgi:hypothetical protein
LIALKENKAEGSRPIKLKAESSRLKAVRRFIKYLPQTHTERHRHFLQTIKTNRAES